MTQTQRNAQQQWQSQIASRQHCAVYNSHLLVYIFRLFSFYGTAILKSLHLFSALAYHLAVPRAAPSLVVCHFDCSNGRDGDGEVRVAQEENVYQSGTTQDPLTFTLCAHYRGHFSMGMRVLLGTEPSKNISRQFIKDFYWPNHFN